MDKEMNRQWRLARRPSGLVRDTDFEWREESVPSPGDGELLVRNLYLSLDPTNRGWMNETQTYLPAVGIGEVMRGITIGTVSKSRHSDFQEGDLVQGILGWPPASRASATTSGG